MNVPERTVFQLRKWIIHHLVSLVDHLHLEKGDAKTKKAVPHIPAMKQHFFPLDDRNCGVVAGDSFSLLQTLSVKLKQTPELTENSKLCLDLLPSAVGRHAVKPL